MTNAATHNEMPTTDIAFGRGPCRNNSDPMNIGIGPALYTNNKQPHNYVHSLQIEVATGDEICLHVREIGLQ